ncbi:metal transporter [Candidatus Bathyarchaeota archaeon ex4484_135]|nr:MAG: metal transporter [Candidatus Bathyarchaeota archaeon ex4484_135]
MHIPDGFLDPVTAALCYAIALVFTAVAIYKSRARLKPEVITLASLLAAAIFAAQMLNWPIPGGTSLHMVGGALVGILLGPWLGELVIAVVLLVQCLVFGDGGITALGANILNMGIIDVLIGYAFFKALARPGETNRARVTLGAFLGGWLGITLAGVACGLEIGYSPAFPFGVAITVPVMGLWHIGLGVIEGIITALVVDYMARKLPSLVMSLELPAQGV